MDDEGVGADHFDGAAGLGLAIAQIELGGAEIGEERNGGRVGAEVEPEAGIAIGVDGDALGADGEGNPELLAGLGQVDIDRLGAGRTARHGAHEQGRVDPLAEEFRSQINLIEVDLGEGSMLEHHSLETGRHRRPGPPTKDDVQMLVLAVDRQ